MYSRQICSRKNRTLEAYAARRGCQLTFVERGPRGDALRLPASVVLPGGDVLNLLDSSNPWETAYAFFHRTEEDLMPRPVPNQPSLFDADPMVNLPATPAAASQARRTTEAAAQPKVSLPAGEPRVQESGTPGGSERAAKGSPAWVRPDWFKGRLASRLEAHRGRRMDPSKFYSGMELARLCSLAGMKARLVTGSRPYLEVQGKKGPYRVAVKG